MDVPFVDGGSAVFVDEEARGSGIGGRVLVADRPGLREKQAIDGVGIIEG